ncbi:MAG TPA: aminopeptidase, partial [Sphaerochaeta sp.]|nr:aminopeptidase [Sphaerochaeta sp.]
FCSFDGEESGLEGSKAWYQKHKEEMSGSLVLNFDAIYHADKLTFLERDINGTQRLSSRLARRCVQIAKDMGYEAVSESIPRLAGGTDAGRASLAGLEATTLTSVAWDDRTKPSVYHTAGDVVSAIDAKAVEMALSIAIRLVELVDSDRLWEVDEMQGPAKKEVESEEPELVFTKLTHR